MFTVPFVCKKQGYKFFAQIAYKQCSIRLYSMPRNKVSIADKERLIACYASGGDYVTQAHHLGVVDSTARTIIWRHMKNLPWGKHDRHKKRVITDEVGQSLIQFVNDNPLATLATTRGFLTAACGVDVSLSNIAGFLTVNWSRSKRYGVSWLKEILPP